MYIQPETNIRILRNVPLDTTYENTIHFNGTKEQYNYFVSLEKYNLTRYTYQRVKRGVCRVGIKADNLFDCNYMMFQNTAYGNKWFYAFITSVEFVNNECAEIAFTIDVMQTWYFDYRVWESFVVREHSASDNIGDNLLDDNLELGEYFIDNFDDSGVINKGGYNVVMASTFYGQSLQPYYGGMFGGIFSGLYYTATPTTNVDGIKAIIEAATEDAKEDGIVSIFMMPSNFCQVGESVGPKSYNITKDKAYGSDVFGFTPKNKKLFTYPYNFLYVTDLNGNSANMPYEFFSNADGKCHFRLTGDTSCNPSIIMYPLNYKGVQANYNEKMVLSDFPQCSYNTDAFKAWLAQSGAQNVVQGVAGSATLGTALGSLIAGSNPISASGLAVLGGINAVANSLIERQKHSVLPRQAKGNQGSSTLVASGLKEFYFGNAHIQTQYAQIIDEYWNMYGYPCNRVKIPNISTRPHWNYVKTANVSITGSMPSDDMDKIKSIYNKGITFWKDGSEVGRYDLDNSI